jgi:two-component system chemotaxis response regulator CheB
MRKAGAATMAQDEASSIVFGMPRAAIELGAVGKVVPANRFAAELMDVVRSA